MTFDGWIIPYALYYQYPCCSRQNIYLKYLLADLTHLLLIIFYPHFNSQYIYCAKQKTKLILIIKCILSLLFIIILILYVEYIFNFSTPCINIYQVYRSHCKLIRIPSSSFAALLLMRNWMLRFITRTSYIYSFFKIIIFFFF